MRAFRSVTGLFVTFFATSAVAQDASRLTTASNVRLRAMPDDAAAVVASVPLGTELVQLDTGGDAATWVRVRTSGPDGWLPTRLTRRFTPDNRLTVIAGVVKDRLARQGDSFGARVELLALVERTLPTLQNQPEPGGQFALLWLQALENVAAAIPRLQARQEPYAGWLKTHDAVVYRHEMAGRWKVRQAAALDLHSRHRDTSAADDIAWFAATHGLPGECEGFVPCHLRRINDLSGTYLRLHPAGRHVDEAVGLVAKAVSDLSAHRGAFFDPGKDCAEIVAVTTPLDAAVSATRAASRSDALSVMGRIRAPCK